MFITFNTVVSFSDVFPDIFKFDSHHVENEDRYKAIKAEILGEGSDEELGSEGSEEDS